MRSILVILLLGGILCIGNSQIAYFNSANLLSELPEIKSADSKLQALQDSLSTSLNEQRGLIQSEFDQHQIDYNNGLLSTKQIEEISAGLQIKKEELNKKESQFQFTLIQRREKLYQPTFDKIDNIVKEIAHGKYMVIFDSSQQGGYLYLDNALDITDLVKSKL